MPEGCETLRAKWILRLSKDGTFIALDAVEPQPTPIPKTSRGNVILANTVIDSFAYLFGVGGPGCVAERAWDYQMAYLRVLDGVDHPAARVIDAFLASPRRPLFLPMGSVVTQDQLEILQQTPALYIKGKEAKTLEALTVRGVLTEDAATLGAWRCVIDNARACHPAPDEAVVYLLPAISGEKMLIEVEGYSKTWWLEPGVLSAHQKRFRSSTPTLGAPACSLCYEQKPLARLFPPSSYLRGSLISFNASAWEGYGQTQGYNVPTCEECAQAVAHGLDDVCSSKGTRLTHNPPDAHLLWWFEETRGEPWPLLETALDPETSEDDAATALAALTDGHFASIEKQQGRVALRRYAFVEADTVRANVALWQQTCKLPVWKVAKALDLSQELLYLSIVANDAIPGRTLIDIRAALQRDAKDFQSWLNQLRAQFLNYATKEIPVATHQIPVGLTDPMPAESLVPALRAFSYLGRAFARGETIQNKRGKTQRSLRFTHFEAAQVRPMGVVDLLKRSYAGYRAYGKMVEDKPMFIFLDAVDMVNSDGTLERPMTSTERSAFRHGYAFQKSIQKAAWEAAKETQESSPQEAK